MADYDLTYKAYGKQAILIEWPARIDASILQDILSFQKVLKNQKIADSIVAYHSLTLVLKQPVKNFQAWVEQLTTLYASRQQSPITRKKIWQIPVCYDALFGLDLDPMSKQIGMTASQIIAMHSSQEYLVYFIGFQPGFLYLGGLPETLHLPRKETPRLRVAPGSVAIGGGQTGIYPQRSAGGWHIIGRTPISLFDAKKSRLCFATSGDFLRFNPIDQTTFYEIQNEVQERRYEPKFTIR